MALKFACITGSLANRVDRFMSCGYKEDNTVEERIRNLAETGAIEALEICFDPLGDENDPDRILALAETYGFAIAGVGAPVSSMKEFGFGSLTNTNPEYREMALKYCRDTIDFCRKINGNLVNIWMGEDGFDYAFQSDYTEQWNLMTEAVRELCDYAPDMKIALEFKLREPRNRCTLDTAGTTLLLAKDVNRKNVGVTVDIGHVFQVQQNAAQVVEMCAAHNMLYHLHINDNYGGWDDDMILGSVRYAEFIELCYSLRKVGYDGWASVDIFPYRENAYKAAAESAKMLQKFDEAVDKIGYDRLTECIKGTDATEVIRLMREHVFR